jgi:radical SAM protein with 4Fe4S-binding SPASM domain
MAADGHFPRKMPNSAPRRGHPRLVSATAGTPSEAFFISVHLFCFTTFKNSFFHHPLFIRDIMVLLKSAKLGVSGIYSGIRYRKNRILNKPQLPTFLVYQLTNRCNSRCIMCNIWQKESTSELTTKEIENVFKGKLFSKLRWVNLTGGEPFMREDIVEVVKCLNALPELEGIAIPSNGFLTDRILEKTEKMLHFLDKKKFLSLTLSIDGFEKTHDEIRGVPGAFKKVIATLEKLQELKIQHANFNVGVQPTISKKNIDEIEEFYNFMKEKSNSVGFAVALTSEGYYNNAKTPVALDDEDKAKISAFFKKIIKNDPQYGFYYSKLARMFKTKQRGFSCLSGFITIYMDPSGNIYPCPVLSCRKDYLFCNAKENAYLSWKTTMSTEMRKRLKKERACESCTMMCDFINFAKVEFIEHSAFMMIHPAILYRLIKKIKNEKNPYF